MKTLTCTLPNSLYAALEERMRRRRETSDHVIAKALSRYLLKPMHTLFQVSTSAALVEGLYQGSVRVSRLLQHGDFGLGAFVNLDGEMVVLDGKCYRIGASGETSEAAGDRLIPYAVVTRFSSDVRKENERVESLASLLAACDAIRQTENMFYAFRVEGPFSAVKTRVMRPASPGEGLKAASEAQKEFEFSGVAGTLVGLWSPAFARSFSVPGYHFHFLSSDRRRGGHLLECSGERLTVQACAISQLHVSLPETEQFLKADLSRDPQDDLMSAEQSSHK